MNHNALTALARLNCLTFSGLMSKSLMKDFQVLCRKGLTFVCALTTPSPFARS